MISRLIATARYGIGTSRLGRAFDPFRAALTLRRAAARAGTPEQIAAAAFAIPYGRPPIAPSQVRSELVQLAGLVRDANAHRILEIGTGNGGTLYVLAWASSPPARLLSLDVRDFGRRRWLLRSFAGRGRRVRTLAVDSASEATRETVRRFFDAAPLDVLFIDGDHAYDAVRRDYELYAPLVRPGGLVALHDIVDGPESSVGGVPRFWRELRGSEPEATELVESWTQGGYGIGVIRRTG